MQNNRTRWLIILSCSLTILLITGCFQAAGDETQVTLIAQNATFTPEPNDTPFPEFEETEDPFFIFEEFEETEEPLFIWEEETETPEPTTEFIDVFVTATPTPEESFLQLEQEDEPPLDLFQEQNLEAPAMTSTALVLTATAIHIAPTLTQEAINQGFDTEIPTEPIDQGGGTGGFAPPIEEPTPIPPQPETSFGQSCIHTVRAGDNLFRISLAYNTDVHQLAAVNGIANINLIVVGQQISIPNCTTGGTGGVIPPTGGSTTYTVRQNDNLFRISLTYNTTVHAIAALNGIGNINLIYIGQVLAIP